MIDGELINTHWYGHIPNMPGKLKLEFVLISLAHTDGYDFRIIILSTSEGNYSGLVCNTDYFVKKVWLIGTTQLPIVVGSRWQNLNDQILEVVCVTSPNVFDIVDVQSGVKYKSVNAEFLRNSRSLNLPATSSVTAKKVFANISEYEII